MSKKEGTDGRGLPETHAVLKKIRAHFEQTAPQVVLLAEVHDTPARVREYFGEDDECHLVYHFSMAEKLFLAALRNDPVLVEEIYKNTPSIPENCQWAVFLRNHDALALYTLSEKERIELSSYCDPEKKYDFNDGNEISMRLASIFKKDPEKIRAAFQMLLMLPCAPILYYGEEIGMENDDAIGHQADTRRYVRGLFDWKKARAEMEDPNSLFSFVQRLLSARKTAVGVKKLFCSA